VAVDTKQLDSLNRKIARAQCFSKAEQRTAQKINTEIVKRISGKGLASDGSRIGTYSEGYFLRANKKSRKVTLVETGNLIADFKPIPLEDGWGHGFSGMDRDGEDFTNADLADALESKYNKKIFEATDEEEAEIFRILNKEINKCIGS
jgi:hypothetical protein